MLALEELKFLEGAPRPCRLVVTSQEQCPSPSGPEESPGSRRQRPAGGGCWSHARSRKAHLSQDHKDPLPYRKGWGRWAPCAPPGQDGITGAWFSLLLKQLKKWQNQWKNGPEDTGCQATKDSDSSKSREERGEPCDTLQARCLGEVSESLPREGTPRHSPAVTLGRGAVLGVQPGWNWSCRQSTESDVSEEGALWGPEDHERSAQWSLALARALGDPGAGGRAAREERGPCRASRGLGEVPGQGPLFVFWEDSSLLLSSRSVLSDSLWPNGLLPTRLPCPPQYPGVSSDSRPLSWWCSVNTSSAAGMRWL